MLSIDLAPTLLDLAAVSVSGFADRVFLIETFAEGSFPGNCAVRSADEKLIRYDHDAGADFEGYDLTGAYGRPLNGARHEPDSGNPEITSSSAYASAP